MTHTYKNLEVQFNKLFRHINVGSYKTRERYAKAFKRFMVFFAREYKLQKLSIISQKHILAYLKFMQSKILAASTVKTELAAIRFFHDSMPYTREKYKDYVAILSLARYAGLRLEECFRIDTNDARKALETGRLFVK